MLIYDSIKNGNPTCQQQLHPQMLANLFELACISNMWLSSSCYKGIKLS